MIATLALAALLALGVQDEASKTLSSLIEKLRSERIDERDQATQELKKLGKAAIPELEKLAADKDVEAATRARTLLSTIRIKELLGVELKELNDLPASKVVDWMEKRTGRKFIVAGDLAIHNYRVRVPEALLNAGDPYAVGVELLRLANLAVSPSDEVPGSVEVFHGAVGGKKGLKVYHKVEALPKANEFCSLVLHPRYVSARTVQAVLINLISFPQNCLSVEDTGTLVLADYASTLRKCAEIVKALDVSRSFQVSVALLEGRTGKDASLPEAFRNLRLAEATGRNQFAVLGTGSAKLERVTSGKAGVAAPPGKLTLRFPGAPPLVVEFSGSIRAEGGPILDRFTVQSDQEKAVRVFEAQFSFKDENWMFVGAVPATDGASLVILARAVAD